jgi:multiple sugar transport system permease protein
MAFDYKSLSPLRHISKMDELSSEQKYNLFTIAALTPALLFLVIMFVIPVVYTIFLSLHEGTLLTTGDWVGLTNYVNLLQDPTFISAFVFGFKFAVVSVLVHLLIGLAIALLINQQFRGSTVARITGLFPYLIPTVIVMTVWSWILSPSHGIVNNLLVHFGIVEDSISFFASTNVVFESLITATSWKYISFAVIILLAKLQTIDDTLYEQAKISGASIVYQFRSITLPNLKSAIFLVVLLRTVWMFNHFDTLWLLTRGGPGSQSTNVPVFVYRNAFIQGDLMVGSAAAIVLFIILLVFAGVYFRVFEPSKEIATQR